MAPSLEYPVPTLTDGVVALRPWTAGDTACVVAGTGGTEADARAWIERQRGRPTTGMGLSLGITDAASDTAVGYVGLLARPKLEQGVVRAEGGGAELVFATQPGSFGIGYWVLERERGRGLATRAVALLAHWALREPGVERIEALVEPGNVPSHLVAERAGFEREGLMRSYLEIGGRRADAVVYSLIRADLDEPEALRRAARPAVGRDAGAVGRGSSAGASS